MPIPEHRGRSADEIATTAYIPDSAWHIWACLLWRDFSERRQAPMALHYAGFHLRTAVEHLWFDVLFAAKGGSVSTEEYEEAVKHATKLYQLIDAAEPHYRRFAEFIQILGSVDSTPHPPTVVWDIRRLRRIHGECGGQLLHFQGVPAKGYLDGNWTESRNRFVFDSANWMWSVMTTRGNIAVYDPEGLKKPEVFSLWERYRDGINSAGDVRIGLKLVQPIVKRRPHE